MLANTRTHSWLVFCLGLLPVAGLPIAAQVQSAPSAMMSVGRDGASAIPAARTNEASRGNNAYSPLYSFGCCSNFFLPSSFTPLIPASPPSSHHRRHDDPTLVAIPVYVPYAVGYAPDDEDDTAETQDTAEMQDTDDTNGGDYAYVYDPPRLRHRRYQKQDGSSDASGLSSYDAAASGMDASDMDTSGRAGSPDDSDVAAPQQPPEPVVAQPATVLIFKDGHHADVVNYAIVGDTLFDFADGLTRKILLADLDLKATQKANNAAGVEFKLPPGSAATAGAN